MNDEFQRRYGPWALVAGGSEGLGAEFARQIAARGVHVVLLALDEAGLEKVASEIRSASGVQVRAMALDFANATFDDEVARVVGDVEIGLFVYNAAAAPIGRFLEQDLADKLRSVDVNCRAPLALAHRFAGPMAARERGGIVLLSSMAAFQGAAMVATYAATKAFNLVLAEGLWSELRECGVDVVACCPGATRTPGYERSNPRGRQRTMDPNTVVRETLDALGGGPTIVPGQLNRLATFFMTRLMPRNTAVRIVSETTERMYDRRKGRAPNS